VQLDLYTQIILSVLSVYQSANKGILTDKVKGGVRPVTWCSQDFSWIYFLEIQVIN
jgi:hypothetical protein